MLAVAYGVGNPVQLADVGRFTFCLGLFRQASCKYDHVIYFYSSRLEDICIATARDQIEHALPRQARLHAEYSGPIYAQHVCTEPGSRPAMEIIGACCDVAAYREQARATMSC